MDRFVNKIEYSVRNIGAFRNLRISLHSGEVTEVSGGNGRGKTTLLRALRWNTTGGTCILPDDIVTDDESDGNITTRFDDDLTVIRTLKPGESSSALTLCDAVGELVNGGKAPATELKKQLGDGVYLNPVVLIGMRPEDRVKAIAAALDLRPETAAEKIEQITGNPVKISYREQIFPAIDAVHATYYEERRQARKDAEDAESQAKGVLNFLPAEWLDAKGQVPPPVEPRPLGGIYDKLSQAKIANGERETIGAQIAELQQWLVRSENALDGERLQVQELQHDLLTIGAVEDDADLLRQIDELQRQLTALRARNSQRQQLQETITSTTSRLERETERLTRERTRLGALFAREKELGGQVDVSALQEQIDAHEAQMTTYREALKIHGESHVRYQQARELRDAAADKRAEWERLERIVVALDHLPIDLLAGVQMPIPGMVIKAGDIYLPDGDTLRKFSAFGDADQMRFAAMMAMTLSPINILIIDGAEKCDEDRRLLLYKMAAAADFIVFSSLVTRGPVQITQFRPESGVLPM